MVIINEDGKSAMKENKNKAELEKYPRLGMAVLLLSAVITFFICVDCKRYLEDLLLPSVKWWFLKATIQTAIIMSYVIPMVIAYILSKSKYAPLQIAGMFFGGIVLGIVVRLALVVAGVLYPY